MVGIVVVSYGRLADALIFSVQSLVGHLEKIKGVAIWSKDREEEVKHRIQKEMAEVDEGDGVVILTDILGGRPTTASLSFLEDDRVEVVTGVNVPMLLTLASYRKGRSLREIGSLLRKSGRRGIILAKEVFRLGRKPKHTILRSASRKTGKEFPR